MLSSLISRDRTSSGLKSYVFSLFLVGLPFTIFGTYVIYQIQTVGFIIGTDSDGKPCTSYCLVSFGKRTLDVNSIILYLNAMGFGIGGVASLLISAYADFWRNKSNLVTITLVLYGAIAVPAYWLRDFTQYAFNSLMALFVAYAVCTYIFTALINMYIPHVMRVAGEESINQQTTPQPELAIKSVEPSKEAMAETNDCDTLTDPGSAGQKIAGRKSGFQMSVFGSLGTTVAGILTLLIVIILTQTLPEADRQSAGLLVTTVVGFILIVGAAVAHFGLPVIPPKKDHRWNTWFLEILSPLKDLAQRKNMLILLLSFTIYVDTVFALNSVIQQLYFIQVKPDTLEVSLYTMAGTLFSLVCTVGFYSLQTRKPSFSLETWLIFGYVIILILPIWGSIGLAESISFGFKNRWEFYVQQLIFNISNTMVNCSFRVIFSELIPKGSEIEWWSLQVVLSCATCWVSYIANAPLQNTTHQLRFPLVLCLIFLILPVVFETLRVSMGLFARDRERWQELDSAAITED